MLTFKVFVINKQTGFHIFHLGSTLQILTTFPKHQFCEVCKDQEQIYQKKKYFFFLPFISSKYSTALCNMSWETEGGIQLDLSSFGLYCAFLLKDKYWNISKSLVLNFSEIRFWFSEWNSSYLLQHFKNQLPIIWAFFKAQGQAQLLVLSPFSE